jgi:alpha-galactosidase
MSCRLQLFAAGLTCLISVPLVRAASSDASVTAAPSNQILTPPAPSAPRINGPRIYGQRPGRPFIYSVPATGDRPITFAASGLPDGLKIDPATGHISGIVKDRGEYKVTLQAKNDKGTDEKPLKIVIGDQIALTPPMGWNSWNCWGSQVSQEKVLQSAHGMADSGLINHGWTYINIDDAWQAAERGGEFHAIQGNEKFPDMKALCDEVHGLGLKVGIYSTPWTISYAGHIGGSSLSEDGHLEKPTLPKKGNVNKKILPWAIGKYHFATSDAKQWAAWGIDYLKYDWNPNELPETKEMYDALNAAGRDVVLSLSNNTPFANISELSPIASCWRTSGDIRDNWDSMSKKGFGEDKWEPYCHPGHWNDPDMLVVGTVGWGKPHPTGLTPDEQYTHISLWCLVSAPLLIGCDMSKMDDFTVSLLSNDEVLAIDQDSLGKQATTVSKHDNAIVYAKDLEDGSKAVGLFNTGTEPMKVVADFSDLKLDGKQKVRDLWRQQDVGQFAKQYEATVAPHGAVLVKLSAVK